MEQERGDVFVCVGRDGRADTWRVELCDDVMTDYDTKDIGRQDSFLILNSERSSRYLALSVPRCG